MAGLLNLFWTRVTHIVFLTVDLTLKNPTIKRPGSV
jgi:hypothetical protein